MIERGEKRIEAVDQASILLGLSSDYRKKVKSVHRAQSQKRRVVRTREAEPTECIRRAWALHHAAQVRLVRYQQLTIHEHELPQASPDSHPLFGLGRALLGQAIV